MPQNVSTITSEARRIFADQVEAEKAERVGHIERQLTIQRATQEADAAAEARRTEALAAYEAIQKTRRALAQDIDQQLASLAERIELFTSAGTRAYGFAKQAGLNLNSRQCIGVSGVENALKHFLPPLALLGPVTPRLRIPLAQYVGGAPANEVPTDAS